MVACIGVAGKAGDWERVMQLRAEMRQLSVKPDVWTFSALMAACQACGNRWKSALEFLEQMEAAGAGATCSLLLAGNLKGFLLLIHYALVMLACIPSCISDHRLAVMHAGRIKWALESGQDVTVGRHIECAQQCSLLFGRVQG